MKYRNLVRESRRGMALMAVVIATFSVVSVLGVLMTLASYSTENADTARRSAEARYVAMGALEVAERELLNAVANWRPAPEGGTAELEELRTDYFIEPTGFDAVVTDPSGIQTIEQGFELRAIGQSRESRQLVSRIVNVQATPIFQFAVFYNNDLEIFPGPNMVLNGRIHTNSNLYMGSNNTLSCNTNYVRAAGAIYRNRKDDPSASPGTVRIRRWVENPFDSTVPVTYVTMNSESQMRSAGVTTVSGYDARFTTGHDSNGDGDYWDSGEWLPWGPGALHYWGRVDSDGLPNGDELPGNGPYPPDLPAYEGHTVLDGTHAVSPALVPSIGSIAMFEPQQNGTHVWNATQRRYVPATSGEGTHSKGYFHENADLSLIVYTDGTWDAFDGEGSSVKYQMSSAVTIKTIYDARQANGTSNKTRVASIDVEKLNASGVFPANGLLYASHYGLGTGTNARGIELANGRLLAAPLTVVSEGAVYVQGNFNTQNKKPAAVVADAVNLLSNAWTGNKTPGTLPTATATTYNLAMITGNQESSVGNYNGGFENLPRFHERWSGVDCRISGAFVSTWNSRYATGRWVYGGDRYEAPNRLWGYDPLFNNVANLPPFTPMVVTARDVVTW